MRPKQLSTASSLQLTVPFCLFPHSLPPTTSPCPPFSFFAPSPPFPSHALPRTRDVPQGRVDLSSSSFGHTGVSPYLSVGARRGVGGGWEG